MRRGLFVFGLLVVALSMIGPPPFMRGWRAAFLLVEAPFAGSVLLLAIGRLSGGDWTCFAPLSRWALVIAPLAAALGLQTLWADVAMVPRAAVPPPADIWWWQNGWMVAGRG